MTEKEFLKQFMMFCYQDSWPQYYKDEQERWLARFEILSNKFLEEHHKEYFEVEFINIAEEEEENQRILQEQESNYNRDIALSIERSS